jgi:DNA-directed RNA polymerase specialized sigma24 family protein
VDRDDAVGRLPVAYQCVVAWLEEGISLEEIGTRLGIDPNAVPALIELARAKLARATDRAKEER